MGKMKTNRDCGTHILRSKGVANDIKNTDNYSELTKEELEEVIKNITLPDDGKELQVFRGCKTNGLVAMFNFCGKNDCKQCKYFSEELKKSFESNSYYVKK